MPTKKVSPIEEHFEKGLLGIAVLVLMYILFAYAISSPTSIELGSSTVKPGNAYTVINERADQLKASAVQQESSWPPIKMPENQSATTQSSRQNLPESLLKPLVSVSLPNPPMEDARTFGDIPIVKEKRDLPKVLAVTKLAAGSGRSTINLSNDAELQEALGVETEQADVSWVTIAGEIDLEKQRLELEKLPEKVEKEPMYIRVDLQRAPVDEKGKIVGEWQDVQFIAPNSLVIAPGESLKLSSMDELRELRNELFSQLGQVEGVALTSELPQVMYGTEWEPPLLPGEKKAVDTERPVREKQSTNNQNRAVQRRTSAKGGMEGGMPGGAGGRGGRASRRGGGGAGGMGGMPGGGGGGGGAAGGGARTARTARRGAAGGAGMPGGMAGGMPGAMGPGMMPGAPGMMPGGGPGMPGGPGMMPGMMPGGQMGAGGMMQQRQSTVQKLTDEDRKTKKTLKIWALDLFARPGKTYKYRMRVVMYNPLAGYKIYLKDPKNTLLTGIPSPWAEAPASVRLENEFYCFVDTLSSDKKSIKFNVTKWYQGNLYSEIFMAKEGEAVGDKKKIKMLPTSAEQKQEDLGTEEVDFNTGLIFAEFTPGQTDREVSVTLKTSDGQTLKQNSTEVKDSSDYKKLQDMLKDQRVRISQWKKKMREMAAQ
jgi:hypothetical protein